MSSPLARRGAWAPDPVIDAPTPRVQGPPDRPRPAFAVEPWPSQHARGVNVKPSANPLSDFTRQDARALGVRDVVSVGASSPAAPAQGGAQFPGDTVVTEATPGACMPLPVR